MRSPGSNIIEIVSTNANDKRPDPTTDSGKSTIRALLNELEAVFHQSVSMHRPALTIEAMKSLRGGVRVGANAVSVRLADRVGSQKGVVYGLPGASASTATATATAPVNDNFGWDVAMKNAVNPPKAKAASWVDALSDAQRRSRQ